MRIILIILLCAFGLNSVSAQTDTTFYNEDWKEIERFDAGHKTGITGKKRTDTTAIVGDIRLANPKQPKNHLILAVFKAQNAKYKTKYSMMLLVDPAPPKVEEPPKKD